MSTETKGTPVQPSKTPEELEKILARLVELSQQTQQHIENMVRLERYMGRR